MQFAQILLTDEQALMTRLALDLVLNDPERYEMTEDERQSYERLAVFFGHVAADPSRFAPTGERVKTIKTMVRRAKGPAQPQSRRKPKRSQGQQKRDRAAQREHNVAYNAAMERYRQEEEEAAEYQREQAERYALEPKVNIMDAAGNIIFAGVPVSMVVPTEPNELVTGNQVVLPPGVSA